MIKLYLFYAFDTGGNIVKREFETIWEGEEWVSFYNLEFFKYATVYYQDENDNTGVIYEKEA
jgi:hypothetical protein